MTSIRESIRRFLASSQPLPPGTYHYQAPPSDPNNYRLHLRLEPDGSGILIVNASTVLHLNQTAAEFAFYLVQHLPEEQVVSNLVKRYRVSRQQALEDYHGFVERIESLILTPDLDPVTFLDFDRAAPFSGEITAPYRIDCALTYQLASELPGAAPLDRVKRELTTQEWKTILDKTWNAGVPHIVFTGGEPTLRADLLELIMHAENNGQVTGLMTDGSRLNDPEYVQELLLTGLDHVTVLFNPSGDQAWQVLKSLLTEDLFVAVHLTMTVDNRAHIKDLIKQLADLGVKAISLSASEAGLNEDLQAARDLEASLDIDLVWNLPVPYSELNPVWLETEQQELGDGSGRAWMYIEPDGDVLPAQGFSQVLGNLLSDTWEEVWSQAQALATSR